MVVLIGKDLPASSETKACLIKSISIYYHSKRKVLKINIEQIITGK